MDETDALAHLARTPAERAASAVPYGGTAVWTAAEIMHWQAWPGMTPEVALAAVAAFGLAFGLSAHKGWGWKVPLLTAAFAAWLALACARGPLSGWPVPSLTIVWAVLTAAAWRMAVRHPAILRAVRWRAVRAEWLFTRNRWKLPGSHLLAHEDTRLGEMFTVDVRETGKLASAVARDAALPERIAMDRGIPRSRVTVTEGTPAGRVVIEIRERNPWAEPIPHPATVDGHEIELDPSPSIASSQPVGQDPATGRPLNVLLCSPTGGRNINIVATLEGGKTTLLSAISERVTACPDALMIRINLSDKGEAERYLWGPACHLTALGPDEKKRAMMVLAAVRGIMRWRARQPKTTADWVPSPGNPHVVLIIDEIDALTEVGALRKALEPIATKGREYGITTVRAGQRGTAEWTGGANIRAVDGVYFLGNLNRSTEAMHVAGELGLRLPDVASYGEGHEGVWVEADKKWGGKWQGGRGWNLCEPADIAGIAEARAPFQPDLPAACKEFLGDDYAALVGSDVYALWARSGGRDRSPAEYLAPGHQAEREDAISRVAVSDGPRADLDRLAAYEREVEEILDGDDDLRARFSALGQTIAEQRASLEEIGSPPDTRGIPEEKLRESSEERWRQAGEQARAEITPEHRAALTALLADGGTTIKLAAAALGVSEWKARAYLQALAGEGIARLPRKGRGARWVLAEGGDEE